MRSLVIENCVRYMTAESNLIIYDLFIAESSRSIIEILGIRYQNVNVKHT